MRKPKGTFTSVLEKFNSKLWAYHIVVPRKKGSLYIDGNDHRVICTLNETERFQTALIHLGDGNFFINVNKKIRDKLKLREGDVVLVRLEKDESEYGLPISPEFKELLKQDIAGSELFHALTPGKQRTLIYIASYLKSPDLRIRNGIAILEHLKRNEGKIDYKQLNSDIKNTY